MNKLQITKGTTKNIISEAGVGRTTFVLQLSNEIMKKYKDYKTVILDFELSITPNKIAKVIDADSSKYTVIQNIKEMNNILKDINILSNTILIIDNVNNVVGISKGYLDMLNEMIKESSNILLLTSQEGLFYNDRKSTEYNIYLDKISNGTVIIKSEEFNSLPIKLDGCRFNMKQVLQNILI